jgi:hypothetical protein
MKKWQQGINYAANSESTKMGKMIEKRTPTCHIVTCLQKDSHASSCGVNEYSNKLEVFCNSLVCIFAEYNKECHYLIDFTQM